MPEQRVNLNTASKDEIESLIMMGDVRAQDIIEKRPFHDWDDIRSLPGISEGLIEDMKKSGAYIQ